MKAWGDALKQEPRTGRGFQTSRSSVFRRDPQFQKGLLRPVGGCSVPLCLSGAGTRVNFSGCAAIAFGWQKHGCSAVYSASQ